MATAYIYNGIAAGKPIYMSDEIERCFYLPNDWFTGAGEFFALNVRGDSMEGAGIENGDLVIIQRQQTAENRDIIRSDQASIIDIAVGVIKRNN